MVVVARSLSLSGAQCTTYRAYPRHLTSPSPPPPMLLLCPFRRASSKAATTEYARPTLLKEPRAAYACRTSLCGFKSTVHRQLTTTTLETHAHCSSGPRTTTVPSRRRRKASPTLGSILSGSACLGHCCRYLGVIVFVHTCGWLLDLI